MKKKSCFIREIQTFQFGPFLHFRHLSRYRNVVRKKSEKIASNLQLTVSMEKAKKYIILKDEGHNCFFKQPN
jgi:hypothetical protein